MKTVRIQYEIPEDRLEALDALMKEAGMKTRTELFNNGMALLRWAIRQRKEGRVVASINYDDKSFRELEMPFFENIVEKSKSRKIDTSSDSEAQEIRS
ncbi:MAG: hypothetical protein IIC22_06515 [Chloroflexi bacterium]|nr:hypothetical protein [Chloroflexota bacterium]